MCFCFINLLVSIVVFMLSLIVNLNIIEMVQSIPEMHKQLEEVNQFFMKSTESFITIINTHPGQFTSADADQFAELIQDIRNDALRRISSFFTLKHTDKCALYDQHVSTYASSSENINLQLVQFRNELEEATVLLKKEQNRKENLLDSFSKKYSQHIILKRTWKFLDQNRKQRQAARELDHRMDEVYRRNLFKKAFFPWRTLTYKEGYENTVRRETQRDISSIHEQYQSIIDILKTKIVESEEMIKIKRAAKGQFAFALNKNLLKTISNLSLEVMSLNQMSLRDGECEEQETRKFMQSVDSIIGQKLGKVREYKRSLLGEDEQGQAKRKKKITFL